MVLKYWKRNLTISHVRLLLGGSVCRNFHNFIRAESYTSNAPTLAVSESNMNILYKICRTRQITNPGADVVFGRATAACETADNMTRVRN